MTFIWYSLLMDAGSVTEWMVDLVYRVVQMIILGILVAYQTGMPGGGHGDRGKGAGGGEH
jgi:hypothetical protein